MDDRKVIEKISRYILDNDISLKKLAKEADMPYHRLWCLLNQNGTIKLADYVAICKAVKEPFDLFLP